MMSHLKDCLVESPSIAGSSEGDNEVEGVKVRVTETQLAPPKNDKIQILPSQVKIRDQTQKWTHLGEVDC